MTGAATLCFVRRHYRPDGGAERFLLRLLIALSQQSDYPLHLISQDSWPLPSGIGQKKLARTGGTRRRKEQHFHQVSQQHLHAQAPGWLVQAHEPIAGCQIYRAGDGSHRRWLAARQDGPVRRAFRHLDPYHRYRLEQETRLFQDDRLRMVVCPSEKVRNELQADFGLPYERTRVIRNGLPPEWLQPRTRQQREQARTRLQLDNNAPLLLFAGSGWARKGLDTVLEALALCQQQKGPAWQLMVIGQDKHSRAYRQKARDLKLTAPIHWFGPRQAVRIFFEAADALILPSQYDPGSNVALEALAMGLPALLSCADGSSELVEPGRNGFIGDPGQPRQYAGWLANESLLLPTDGPAAPLPAHAKGPNTLDMSVCAGQYLQLYAELQAERG